MRIDNFAPNSALAPRAASRPGFTLVELMVAMALSLFLMTILAEAFAVSMDTFRGLRALGDMQDTLRTSLRQMREDLSAPHFEGARKLSDANFWVEPRREGFFYIRGSYPLSEGVDGNQVPSSRGYDHVLHFAVRRRGYRPENFFSVGSFVVFNVTPAPRYVPASNPLETFYGNSGAVGTPGLSLKSQWAEVMYSLRPMPVPPGSPAGTTTPTTPESNSTVQLFNLYRTEMLVLPYVDSFPATTVTGNNTLTYDGTGGSTYMSRIASNGNSNFVSPNDNAMQTGGQSVASVSGTGQTVYQPATKPNRGIYYPLVKTPQGTPPYTTVPYINPPNPPTPPAVPSLVCTNVISFQVRLLVQTRSIIAPNGDPNPNPDPVNATVSLNDIQDRAIPLNTQDSTPTGIDSASLAIPLASPPSWTLSTASSPATRIMGLQIRLRVYDPASGQARQNTLVQGL